MPSTQHGSFKDALESELSANLKDAVQDLVDEIEANKEMKWTIKKKKDLALAFCEKRYAELVETSWRSTSRRSKSEKRVIDGFCSSKETTDELKFLIDNVCFASVQLIKKRTTQTFIELNKDIVIALAVGCEKEETSYDDMRGSSSTSDASSLFLPTILASAVVVLIVAVLLVQYYTSAQTDSYLKHDIQCQTNAEKKLEQMKEMYISQPNLLWKIVSNVCVPHACTEPGLLDAPLRLVTVTFEGTPSRIDNCIVRNISNVLGEAPAVFDLSAYHSGDVSGAKERLHDDILRELLNGKRVLVMEHVDSLPYEVAKLFFKFCDSENTKYPGAMYIFPLHLTRSQNGPKDVTNAEEAVTNHLENVWHTSDLGQVRALVARITDMTVQLVYEPLLQGSGMC